MISIQPWKSARADLYRELYDRQGQEIGTVLVPRQPRDPHPIIACWLKQEDADD
jgi:hypothetical protein